MEIQNILDRAYEAQHFGFHPRTFIDGIYNIFYETIFVGMRDLQEYLCQEKGHVVSPDVIKANADAMFQKLTKFLDMAIDKLELYADINILCIPNTIVLPEDKVHLTHSYTEADEEDLDRKIEEIKQKIIMEQVRKSTLKTKLAEQRFVKQELLSFQEKIQNISSVINQANLTTETLNTIVNSCGELLNVVKQYQQQSTPKEQQSCNKRRKPA